MWISYISSKLPKSGRWRFHAVALAVVATMVLVAYPTWCASGAYGFDDLARLNIPQRMLLAWLYLNGHWPLWNPFNFAGQPFLAAGQSGPLYLPNVLFLFIPVVPAVKVSYLLHEWLAAFGTYAAAYHLSKSRLGGVVAAASFLTCGFLLGHQIHTQMFDAVCWLPISFWLCLCILDSVTVPRVAGLAVALAMETYAGHPQVTFYVYLFLGLYLLLAWLFRPTKLALRRSAAVISAMVYAALLAAAQWLPTLNLVTYSSRGNVTPGFLLNLSMMPQGLVQFLTPFGAGGGYLSPPLSRTTFLDVYGNSLFWEFTCYAGLVALIVAFAAVVTQWRTSPAVLALVVIAVVSVCFALGSYGFFADVLVHVPGFDMFRVPARYVGITDFCIAMLSAVGVAALQSSDVKLQYRTRVAITAGCAIAGVGLIVAKVTVPLTYLSWYTLALTLCLLGVLGVSQVRLAWFTAHARVLAVVGLAMLDSLSQSADLSTFVLTSPTASYTDPPPAVQFLQKLLGPSTPFLRAADFDAGDLAQDKSAAVLIPALNGYDSLDASWYDATIGLTWTADGMTSQPRSLLDALGVKYVLTPADWHPMIPTARTGVPQWDHWLDVPKGTEEVSIHLTSIHGEPPTPQPLCSVTLSAGSATVTKWINGWTDTYYSIRLPKNWPTNEATHVSVRSESWSNDIGLDSITFVNAHPSSGNEVIPIHQPLAPLPWKRVFTDGHTTVWENPDSLAPAWVSSDEDAPVVPGDARVQLLAWSPNRQEWRLSQSSGGVFVLSQMFDPNWHATVDGHPVNVQRVGPQSDDVLTGVKVAPGNHDIVLTYSPRSFTLGLTITLLSAVLLIALCLYTKRRRRSA
jgi:hypothetical protein